MNNNERMAGKRWGQLRLQEEAWMSGTYECQSKVKMFKDEHMQTGET